VINMQRGRKLTPPSALEMPERFDPSGIPCVDSGHTRTRAASSHRRHARLLAGLSPTSVIASVEEVAAKGDGDWLVWGSVCNRPVLFAVEAGAAAEMMDSVTKGGMATAIIEPWQLMLEQLD
jgi:hypothetical protein